MPCSQFALKTTMPETRAEKVILIKKIKQGPQAL